MPRLMDIQDWGEFEFKRNWFRTRNMVTFREFVLPHWAGQPVTYLEIGVYEGMSLVWMMQHVLTHPDSRAIGIDPWLMTSKQPQEYMDAVRNRAQHNLARWSDRCVLIRANSDEILNCMVQRPEGHLGVQNGTLDLCMIDGDHYALPVWNDARLCLQLLRPGGWMLFDDVKNDLPKWDHVVEGVNRFIEEAGDRVKEVWRHKYMVCYEKVS